MEAETNKLKVKYFFVFFFFKLTLGKGRFWENIISSIHQFY